MGLYINFKLGASFFDCVWEPPSRPQKHWNWNIHNGWMYSYMIVYCNLMVFPAIIHHVWCINLNWSTSWSINLGLTTLFVVLLVPSVFQTSSRTRASRKVNRWRRVAHGIRAISRLVVDSSGYGSIPINTIFSGMNIHWPAILGFTRGTRFWHTAKYQQQRFIPTSDSETTRFLAGEVETSRRNARNIPCLVVTGTIFFPFSWEYPLVI